MATLGEYLGAGSGTTKLLLHLNGNSTDSSGNGNNGTDSNISYVAGKFGQCAQLANTSKSSIVSTSDLNLQSAFTISAWVYQTSNGTGTSYEENILTKDNETTNNRSWRFCITGPAETGKTRFLRFIYNVPSNLSVFSASGISLNTWTNVIIVSTQGTYTFYINGVASGNGNTNITPVYQGTAPLCLGVLSIYSYLESLIGSIDEVIVENRAWSAEEVKKYYTYSKGMFGIV